jgi:hypothetical protein
VSKPGGGLLHDMWGLAALFLVLHFLMFAAVAVQAPFPWTRLVVPCIGMAALVMAAAWCIGESRGERGKAARGWMAVGFFLCVPAYQATAVLVGAWLGIVSEHLFWVLLFILSTGGLLGLAAMLFSGNERE